MLMIILSTQINVFSKGGGRCPPTIGVLKKVNTARGFPCTWSAGHPACFGNPEITYAPTVAGLLTPAPLPTPSWGRILGRNPDKSFKSFLLGYSQSPLTALHWDFYFFKITQPLTVSAVQLLYTNDGMYNILQYLQSTTVVSGLGKRKRSLIYLPKHYLCWRHSNVSNCNGASLHSIIWGMIFLIEEMRENFVIRRNHFLLRRPCRQTNRVDNLTCMSITCSFQNLSVTVGALFRAME